MAAARLEERFARARWFDTLSKAKSRFAPAELAEDALDTVKRKARSTVSGAADAASRRPGALIGVAAGICLFLLRKPIAKAVQSRIERRNETGPQDEALATYEANTAEAEASDAPPPLIFEEM